MSPIARNPRNKTLKELATDYVTISSKDPLTNIELTKDYAPTMPELIHVMNIDEGRGTEQPLKRKSGNYLTRSEEHVGTDEKGKYVNPGERVIITLHGGGII